MPQWGPFSWLRVAKSSRRKASWTKSSSHQGNLPRQGRNGRGLEFLDLASTWPRLGLGIIVKARILPPPPPSVFLPMYVLAMGEY